MTVPFAIDLAGGSLVFLVVVVAGYLVFAFSDLTRRGSGINQHPYGDIDHNSGPERPSELHHDITAELEIWGRGVGRRHRRH